MTAKCSDEVAKGINALGQHYCQSPNGPKDGMDFRLGYHHPVIYTCFGFQHLQGSQLNENSKANQNELNYWNDY